MSRNRKAVKRVKPKPAKCSGRQSCENLATGIHECPYQVDINDNSEFKCTCCAECQHECAMDI